MVRIRRFGVMKTATTVAALYMVTIAIFFVPLGLLALAFGSTFGNDSGVSSSSVMGGVIAFGLVLILGYGLAGWVFTAVACALYNLVAGWTGGFEFQLDTVPPPPPVPTWNQPTTPPATPQAPPPG